MSEHRSRFSSHAFLQCMCLKWPTLWHSLDVLAGHVGLHELLLFQQYEDIFLYKVRQLTRWGMQFRTCQKVQYFVLIFHMRCVLDCLSLLFLLRRNFVSGHCIVWSCGIPNIVLFTSRWNSWMKWYEMRFFYHPASCGLSYRKSLVLSTVRRKLCRYARKSFELWP